MKSKSKQTSLSKDHSHSFLDKFKNKHSVISKQGLLKLFDSKRKSIEHKIQLIHSDNQSRKSHPKPQPKNKSPSPLKLNLKQLQNAKVQQIIKARSARKGSSDSVARSVQLPLPNNRLPNINKSVSTTLKLNKKEINLNIPQTDSLPKIMKKSPLKQERNQKSSPRYNFELDKFAVDHLSFLQKFEERLKKRQVISQ